MFFFNSPTGAGCFISLQAFAMCLLDYDFMVLDNAFLVHKPGIKRRTEIKKPTESDEWTVHVLQKEVMILLGKRDGC